MVGLVPLEHAILVRIQVPELKYKKENVYHILFFVFLSTLRWYGVGISVGAKPLE